RQHPADHHRSDRARNVGDAPRIGWKRILTGRAHRMVAHRCFFVGPPNELGCQEPRGLTLRDEISRTPRLVQSSKPKTRAIAPSAALRDTYVLLRNRLP